MIPTQAGYGPSKYGLQPQGFISEASTALSSVATADPAQPDGKLLHPANPLLAFAVIAAVAFGAMAVSTSAGVRVGRTKASAGISIGDTK